MHRFSELIYRCSTFTLQSLKEVEDKVLEELKTNAETSLVKALEMIQKQGNVNIIKIITAEDIVFENQDLFDLINFINLR